MTNTVAKVSVKALNNKIVGYLSDSERQHLSTACQQFSWQPVLFSAFGDGYRDA
jgi:ribosomal protein S17E